MGMIDSILGNYHKSKCKKELKLVAKELKKRGLNGQELKDAIFNYAKEHGMIKSVTPLYTLQDYNNVWQTKIQPQMNLAAPKNPMLQSIMPGQPLKNRLLPEVAPHELTPEEIAEYKAGKKKAQKPIYEPTEEQIEARNQRREQQKAYSNARKYLRQGSKTVKNPATGLYEALPNPDAQYARNVENSVRTSYEEMKSLHPNRLSPFNNILKEQEARVQASAQANPQPAVEPQPTAEPQPTNKPQKLSVAERLKNASPEVQQRYASRFGKGGFLSKLKGKAGKTLLAAGALYGLYKLGSAIFGGSDEKTDDVKEVQKFDETPKTPAAEKYAIVIDETVKDNKTEKTDSSTVVPVVPPAVDNNNDEKVDETKEEQKTEKPDEVKKEQNAEEKDDVKNDKKAEEAKESGGFEVDENGAYTVKKGDCVWNIAKAYLVTSGKDSSDKAIQAQVDKIMDANPNLKWKSKGDVEKYFVDIFAGDKIIIPNAKKAEKADEAEEAKKEEETKKAEETEEDKKAA